MSLFASAVKLPDPAERGDAPVQDSSLAILLAFSKHGPIRALPEVSSYGAFVELAGLEDIEHEHPARAKRLKKMPGKSREPVSAVGLVEAIIQTSANRGDRIAPGQPHTP